MTGKTHLGEVTLTGRGFKIKKRGGGLLEDHSWGGGRQPKGKKLEKKCEVAQQSRDERGKRGGKKKKEKRNSWV